MKLAPTLFDEVYRATFISDKKRRGIGFVDHPELLRQHLRSARKFVLDDKMSAFLVDLSSAAFLNYSSRSPRHTKIVCRLVDQLRLLARLPHHLTWVEFNFRSASQRARELSLTNPQENGTEEMRTERQGWLLNQHPTNETLFRVHIFENMKPFGLLTLPFAYGWYVDDQPSVWTGRTDHWQSEICSGVVDYKNDRCGIVKPEYFDEWDQAEGVRREMFTEFLRVHSSTLRRVWALFATVNDIPIEARSVVPTKGFIARGRYRTFLDHKVITLRVPDTADKKKVARDLVAISRRRAHQVRGFWRKDWRRPLQAACAHEFDSDMICIYCGGHQIWVHEHQRGDATLGFVMHDFIVEHNEEAAE
jgi:hypothetical protein